jgi:hypothetical protein
MSYKTIKYSSYYKKITDPEYFNESYSKWIDKVEKIVYNKLHLQLLDLPDQMYMHYFEKKCKPHEMADILFEDLLLDIDSEDEINL